MPCLWGKGWAEGGTGAVTIFNNINQLKLVLQTHFLLGRRVSNFFTVQKHHLSHLKGIGLRETEHLICIQFFSLYAH